MIIGSINKSNLYAQQTMDWYFIPQTIL